MKLTSIETKKIRIGDIDIAYLILGKGNPFLIIPGLSMTMDMREPMFNGLPDNHIIILFDNRGIRQTTAGNDSTTFTIEMILQL